MQAAQHDGGSSAEGSVPESKKRVAKTLSQSFSPRACESSLVLLRSSERSASR